MNLKKILAATSLIFFLAACQSGQNNIPTVGFVDAFEDATISRARDGFTDALKKNGFSEDQKTVKIIYRNAQGDIPTLTQIANYFISEKADIIGTSTTLSTISVAQKTKTIPIFMMVSPTPALMKLVDSNGKPPANLFGVEEELAYIDTSFSIIPHLVKPKGKKLTVGMIYNQSEPQSADAMNRIKDLAVKLDITLKALPLNASADAQLITKSLLSNHIDAFFANPDNTVFASFETILKSCNQQNIPIFTSEAGLVERGAVAAFGADIYQWGYQAGEQAAQYLKTKKIGGLKPEMVKVRKRVYNAEAAKKFNISIPPNFEAVK
jgi:putative ABC transport system substrate-binding protein